MAIRHKRKATTGYPWLPTDLVDGQVGINTVDGTLHVLKTDNTVQTIRNGLQNIVEDLTPQLGGALETLDNNIYITDSGSIIEGAIGKSTDGIALAYTGADGIYTDTEGAINLVPGSAELHGTTALVKSLVGTEARQVYCSSAGVLYSVLPPAPGWSETDTDNGDYSLTALGTWVEITGLVITVPQDVIANSRLDIISNLHIVNTTNRGGSIAVNWGVNGAQPTAGGIATRVERDFNGVIPVNISTSNHAGFTTGDTITVWAQISDQDNSQFNPDVNGSVGAVHEMEVSVPGEGGTGGTLKELFHSHNGTVTQSFTTSITVNFGTIVRNDAIYTSNIVVGGSEITISKAGWYEVTTSVSVIVSGNTRTTSETSLEVNGVQLPGSLAFGYHRNNTDGQNTATSDVLIQVSVGDIIRVRVRSLDARAVDTIANGCRLTIKETD